MNTPLFTPYRNLIIIAVLVAVFVYALVQYAVAQRVDRAVLATHTQLGELSGELKRIAETTAKNEAIAPYADVVTECAVLDRQRYNDLLSRLDRDLSPSELTELQSVYAECAYLQSDRKILMADLLNREIKSYRVLVDQLELLGQPDEAHLSLVADWQSLARAEEERAKLFSELVSQQRSIIGELQAGASANNDRVQRILQAVQETQTELNEVRQEIQRLHQSLGILSVS